MSPEKKELFFGRKITAYNDPLQKLTLERLIAGIKNPKQPFKDKIEQLRVIKSINLAAYKNQKKDLPYFVCGNFHPAVRRKEHFASIVFFVLDLDHLAAANLDKVTLKNKLSKLPICLAAFVSPGNDGLKVLFRLEKPCTDLAMFSSFYKIFSKEFAVKNQLESVVDYNTSDATRACFLTYDADVYFNPTAESVLMKNYLKNLDFELSEKDIKEADKFVKNLPKMTPKKGNELSNDILSEIKQKLNPNYRKPKEKKFFVPKEIEKAVPILKESLANFEMKVVETNPISYGRKVKLTCKGLWAEINIFYGKKGFNIVPTTKTGSNLELAVLASQAIEQVLTGIDLEDIN